MEEIVKYFRHGYEWLVFPVGMRNAPIEMSKFLKTDGTYYSIAEIEASGNGISAVNRIDDRFLLINFGFSNGEVDERSMFKLFAESKGLVNMRKLGEPDYTKLNGNEFGLYSDLEIQNVPVVVSNV